MGSDALQVECSTEGEKRQGRPGRESARGALAIPGAARHEGLSRVSYLRTDSGQTGVLKLVTGGSIVLLDLDGMGGIERKRKPGYRGKVGGWNGRMVGRLMRTIGGVCAWAIAGGFVVELTQPMEFVGSREAKRALKRFVERVCHKWGEAAGFWVLEYQERGAAHFHLIVYGIECELGALREWANLAWYQCLRSGDPKHLAAGVRVARVKSVPGAVGYLVRHMGKGKQKVRPDGESGGRWWGRFGRGDLYHAEVVERSLDGRQMALAMRFYRQLRLARARRGGRWKEVAYWRHRGGRHRRFDLWCGVDVMMALEEVCR